MPKIRYQFKISIKESYRVVNSFANFDINKNLEVVARYLLRSVHSFLFLLCRVSLHIVMSVKKWKLNVISSGTFILSESDVVSL